MAKCWWVSAHGGLAGAGPAWVLGRFTGPTPWVLPGTDGLSQSRTPGCVTGSQREAASEPPCDRDPSLHRPGLAATEPPSNAVSFEVEEGNDLFWGSIYTRCLATATPSRALHALPPRRSTRALPPCRCLGVTRRCPCPFLLPCSASTAASPALGGVEASPPLPPGAGGWICAPQIGQEGRPAAPPPPGNQCHSCGARGARGHPPKHP